jgi:hypothetical protein
VKRLNCASRDSLLVALILLSSALLIRTGSRLRRDIDTVFTFQRSDFTAFPMK